jgi:hypothetical protein
MNLYESKESVRQRDWCEQQCVAVRTVVCAQCARQCAAVFLVVCGSAHGSVRLSGSTAVCGSAAVCGSMRQCSSVCVAVHGSNSAAVRGSVRGCVKCGSARGSAWQCVAVFGSVWQCARRCVAVRSTYIFTQSHSQNMYWHALIQGAVELSPLFLAFIYLNSSIIRVIIDTN